MKSRLLPFVFCCFLLQPFLLLGQTPVENGQRVFICGHSFNWFIEQPLETLAKEGGFSGHRTVGITKIGDSRPIQHWNLPEGQNPAKEALKSGKVDVLTLALHREMPEPGVNLFADYAYQFNPNIRVMEQVSWPDFPMQAQTDWNKMPAISGAYLKLARAQAEDINRKHGNRQMVTLVPVVSAVMKLREKIESGQMPGIKTFGELFVDPKGHPSKPLADLTVFCWYSAIYKKSPVGLTSLDLPGDPTSAAMNRELQQMAWDAVNQEPMGGVAPRRLPF